MKRDADGYTWLQQSLTLPLTIGFGTAPYKAEEVQPIAGLFGDSLVVSVVPDSEFQSFQIFVDTPRPTPACSTGGAKTKAAIQVGSAMIWRATGIDVNYVAYSSGVDAIVCLLGGNTMCNASSVSGALDYYNNAS
jgi:tripartite-type tricarboxylate transporter receptor subunit TctC